MLGRAQFIQLILFTPLASLCGNQGSVPETPVPLIFQRQLQNNIRIRQYSVTVETHIHILKSAPYLLVFRGKQYHFVDRVALSRIEEFQEATKNGRPGNILWSLNRAAFVSEIFLGGYKFTQDKYRLKFVSTDRWNHLECHVYQVDPIKKHHARGDDSYFQGKIWVHPDDCTIVHSTGLYVPASRLHFSLVEFHNFEFEFSWVELQQGLWLPAKVITNNSGLTRDDTYPEFEAITLFRDWTLL
ncbi:MAG TPA: hypothetical protein VK805_20940 [Candidatus Baltobacteraceae bacterium]|nr:hypothetical protein [Candidatus Baltobacteraceae bacterium]